MFQRKDIGGKEVNLNIKITNDKVKDKLKSYLSKIESYNNFDSSQLCRVFLSSDGDLIGFESLKYNLNFVSMAHKLIEINNCQVIECDYLQFSRAIKSL